LAAGEQAAGFNLALLAFTMTFAVLALLTVLIKLSLTIAAAYEKARARRLEPAAEERAETSLEVVAAAVAAAETFASEAAQARPTVPSGPAAASAWAVSSRLGLASEGAARWRRRR